MNPSLDGPALQRTYRTRFEGKGGYRTEVWRVLAPYFEQWLSRTGVILDLGSGYCEFINEARARVRYAMDLNPGVRQMAAGEVAVLVQDCSEPWPFSDGELDAVFTSNFLEHLPSKAAVAATLENARRCLKTGGRFIAMGPNIKYLPGAYWDFFDHFVPLTELSLAEALVDHDFEIERQTARFLPYSMSGGRRYPTWMLRLYLAIPAIWPIFGKQFLVVGRKR